MKSVWIYAWIFLLATQLLAVWITRTLFNESPEPSLSPPVALLPLARQTNLEWGRLAGGELIRRPSSNGGKERLLERESLIMELRQLARALEAIGVELEVVEELQLFMHSTMTGETLPLLNVYINGVLGWAKPFANPGSGCTLERLAIHPAVGSHFPTLVFEISGKPHTMARRIMTGLEGESVWQLQEMDLLATDQPDIWWMRGSYSFFMKMDS